MSDFSFFLKLQEPEPTYRLRLPDMLIFG